MKWFLFVCPDIHNKVGHSSMKNQVVHIINIIAPYIFSLFKVKMHVYVDVWDNTNTSVITW